MSAVDRRYRADIDGLRAVAVLLVIAFHYRFEPFSGGLIGVDVFFVISGFLITKLIVTEVHDGSFSYLKFIARRAARLFPALVVMLVAVTVAAWFIYPPRLFAEFGKALLAGAAFLGNVFYGRHLEYSADSLGTPALLHTWSLAVEEHYYLIIPLMMLCASYLFGRRYLTVLLGVFILSFVAALIWVERAPVQAFYWTPFRMWQLALGGIVALMPRHPVPASQVSILLGLSAILFAAVWMSPESELPGGAALVPCLGTAMILYSGGNRDDPVHRVMAWRPLVWTGRLSYSLYLWHWPILVMLEFGLARSLSVPERMLCLVVSVLVAMWSWQWIEQPVRRMGRRSPPFRTIAACVIPLAVVAIMGLVINRSGGVPSRVSDHVLALEASVLDPAGCLIGRGDKTLKSECRFIVPNARRTLAVWGDSHAAVFVQPLRLLAEREGVSFIAYAKSGCPPLLDVTLVAQGVARDDCMEFRNAVTADIERSGVDTVMLISRWPSYARVVRGVDFFLLEPTSGTRSTDASQRALDYGLKRTVAEIRKIGADPIVLGPSPEFGRHVVDCLASRKMLGGDEDYCTGAASELRDTVAVVEDILDRSGAHRPSPSMFEALCPDLDCAVTNAKDALYRDDNHLSLAGGRLIAERMDFGAVVRGRRVP